MKQRAEAAESQSTQLQDMYETSQKEASIKSCDLALYPLFSLIRVLILSWCAVRHKSILPSMKRWSIATTA